MTAKKKQATDTSLSIPGNKPSTGHLVAFKRGVVADCMIVPYTARELTKDPTAPAAPEFAQGWKALQPEFPGTVQWTKVGQYISGVYAGTKVVQANNKSTTLYLLDVGLDKPERISIFETTSLTLKMGQVKSGDRVLIQLVGMRTSTKFSNSWYDFEVRVAR